jgi:hypothetical protein
MGAEAVRRDGGCHTGGMMQRPRARQDAAIN